MRRSFACFVASVSLLAGLLASLAVSAVGAPPASAYPSSTVAVSGHGFGHGRGMGQFGALGYALAGQSYTQIVEHFYSNTTAGTIPNNNVTVQIAANDGQDTIVTQEKGNLTSSAGTITAPNNAVLIHVKDATANLLTVYQGQGCTGGSPGWTVIADNVTGPVRIKPTAPSADHSDMLQLCRPGISRWYEGDILGLVGTGQGRTVNELPMEAYLRGV